MSPLVETIENPSLFQLNRDIEVSRSLSLNILYEHYYLYSNILLLMGQMGISSSDASKAPTSDHMGV
jgi:hypothetical protein